ncbi:MAG TPA: hypothetical protein VE011_00515 [Candidatus Dormibacteraeota bacterium]|nr:hypothetical protein [Candidatus Dormibacteraeota bacterium]
METAVVGNGLSRDALDLTIAQSAAGRRIEPFIELDMSSAHFVG